MKTRGNRKKKKKRLNIKCITEVVEHPELAMASVATSHLKTISMLITTSRMYYWCPSATVLYNKRRGTRKKMENTSMHKYIYTDDVKRKPAASRQRGQTKFKRRAVKWSMANTKSPIMSANRKPSMGTHPSPIRLGQSRDCARFYFFLNDISFKISAQVKWHSFNVQRSKAPFLRKSQRP